MKVKYNGPVVKLSADPEPKPAPAASQQHGEADVATELAALFGLAPAANDQSGPALEGKEGERARSEASKESVVGLGGDDMERILSGFLETERQLQEEKNEKPSLLHQPPPSASFRPPLRPPGPLLHRPPLVAASQAPSPFPQWPRFAPPLPRPPGPLLPQGPSPPSHGGPPAPAQRLYRPTELRDYLIVKLNVSAVLSDFVLSC